MKYINHILLPTALFLMLSSCSYLKNVNLLLGGEVKREHFVQAIPFQYKKGLIVVRARINQDKTEREFIFDTGAFNSKIEKGLADELSIPTYTTKTNSDSNGNEKVIEVARIDSISFGETTFYKIGAGKVEYDENSGSKCIASGGIIGANLIKLVNWKIDYEKQMIYFSDEAFEFDDNTNPVSVIEFERPLLSATPKINLKLNERSVQNIIFDLGYNGSLYVPATIKDAFQSDETEVFLDQSIRGIYGSRIDTLTSKKLKIGIGEFEGDAQVDFSANGKGLLGNEILEHFAIIIDNNNDQIKMQQISEIETPRNYGLIPGILNDTLWVVDRVEQGSELKLGDTLISVNDKTPSDIFQTHCDYIMGIGGLLSENDSLKIELTNGKEIFQF